MAVHTGEVTGKRETRLGTASAAPESTPHYAIYHLQADKGTWYYSVNFVRKGKRIYRRPIPPVSTTGICPHPTCHLKSRLAVASLPSKLLRSTSR